jgi:hypothetical protein
MRTRNYFENSWGLAHRYDADGFNYDTRAHSCLRRERQYLTDPSGKQYIWDFENRLTQVVNPGGWPTFTFFVKVGTHTASGGSFILISPH